MWKLSTKADVVTQKDDCFHDLMEECKRAPPGAKLSYGIRMRLERFAPKERTEIVNRIRSGCSPFFIACKRGQTEMVEYLIYVCNADIEQRGSYEVLDERSVHHVTPLWCAAVSGKLSVIQVLLQHGADINAVSDTGSTPVRSACFMTHLDIVKYLVEHGADINRPNYNGGTCLINSVQSVALCRFLLEHGADVNAKDIQSKTALHYAIQEHRLETTRLLIEHGADYNAKSRYGDDALQTACLKGAVRIFEYLTEALTYTSEKLVNAYELLGSTSLDEHNDLFAMLHYWRVAIFIRESEDGLLPKTPAMPARAAFRYQKEFASSEELENLMTDLDAIRIQSLLVTERILGPSHKDTVFRLMFRGASYVDVMRYQRCIDLWRRALEIRVEKDTILYSDTCFTAQAVVRLMIDYNEKSKRLEIVERNDEQRFLDVIAVFKLLTAGIEDARVTATIRPTYKRQVDSFDKILKCITHLLYLMTQTAKTDEQRLLVKAETVKLVKIDPRCIVTGDTLLHLVVTKGNTLRSSYFVDEDPILIFPKMEVIQLLLNCGTNVNSRNGGRSTPLHISTMYYNYTNWLVKVLLDYGAHIDLPNASGETPTKKLMIYQSSSNICIMSYVSLKCLCATIVSKFKIPYRNLVPKTLETFILQHEP